MTCRQATNTPRGKHTINTTVVHSRTKHKATTPCYLTLSRPNLALTLKEHAKAFGCDQLGLQWLGCLLRCVQGFSRLQQPQMDRWVFITQQLHGAVAPTSRKYTVCVGWTDALFIWVSDHLVPPFQPHSCWPPFFHTNFCLRHCIALTYSSEALSDIPVLEDLTSEILCCLTCSLSNWSMIAPTALQVPSDYPVLIHILPKTF